MEMKVRVTQTNVVEGEISEKSLVDAFEQYIREKTGLGHMQWVREKDGALMQEVDAYHGSNWDENQGQATEAQKIGHKMINQIKDIYYGKITK